MKNKPKITQAEPRWMELDEEDGPRVRAPYLSNRGNMREAAMYKSQRFYRTIGAIILVGLLGLTVAVVLTFCRE